MNTLLLRLAAPMQAWGADSKFETRRTGREPTKSGVIGMIAAAEGIPRDGDLSGLRGLRFGVRADREGTVMRDFHTAHSEKTSYITYRCYLSDAVFLAGLESGERALLEDIRYALEHPAFPLFLGRRACTPSQPLVLGIREGDLESVFAREPWHGASWRGSGMPAELRAVVECAARDAGAAAVRDVPLSFDPEKRRYGFRAVREYTVKNIAAGAEATRHDPMSEL